MTRHTLTRTKAGSSCKYRKAVHTAKFLASASVFVGYSIQTIEFTAYSSAPSDHFLRPTSPIIRTLYDIIIPSSSPYHDKAIKVSTILPIMLIFSSTRIIVPTFTVPIPRRIVLLYHSLKAMLRQIHISTDAAVRCSFQPYLNI